MFFAKKLRTLKIGLGKKNNDKNTEVKKEGVEPPSLSLLTEKTFKNRNQVLKPNQNEPKVSLFSLAKLQNFFNKKKTAAEIKTQTGNVIKKPILEKKNSTRSKSFFAQSINKIKKTKTRHSQLSTFKDENSKTKANIAVINNNFWDRIKKGLINVKIKSAISETKIQFRDFRNNDHKLQLIKETIITDNKLNTTKKIIICSFWIASMVLFACGVIVYLV